MTTRHAGRGRLVLLRGGRDARASAREDADWDTFCARIGWASAPEALSDHDERLLVDRLLGTLDRTIDPAVVRGVAPEASPRAPSAWARQVVVASTMLAVAAAIGLVVAATLSWQARAAARAVHAEPEVLATSAPRLRSIAPVEKARHAVDPPMQEPDAPKKPRKAPPAPAPPEPPGAIASVRAADTATPHDPEDDLRAPRSRAGDPAGEASSRGAAVIAAAGSSTATVPVLTDAERFSAAAPSTLAVAGPQRVLGVETLAARSPTWVPAVSEGVRATPASWSIAPAGERWFGASLPPSPAGSVLPGGIGVVAQLDLGKAIGQF